MKKKMLASTGAFPIPLPSDVMSEILSFIPPKWTEITRETPIPEDGYFMMVLAQSRYKYRDARFYLVNEAYSVHDVMTVKRGHFNFMTCEAADFLRFQEKSVADVITVGDIFPHTKTPQAIEQLYKFNAKIYHEQMQNYILSLFY